MTVNLTRLTISQRIALGLGSLLLISALTGISDLLIARRASNEFQDFADLSDGYRLLLDVERDAAELQRLILVYRLSPGELVLAQLRQTLESTQERLLRLESSAIAARASELYAPMTAIYATLPEHIESLGLLAAELRAQRQTLRDSFASATTQAAQVPHLHLEPRRPENEPATDLLRLIYDAQVAAEGYLRTHEYALQQRFFELLRGAERNVERLSAADTTIAQQAAAIPAFTAELAREFNLLVQIDRNLIFHTNVVIAGSTNELNRLAEEIRGFIRMRQSEAVVSVRRQLERAQNVVLWGFAGLLVTALMIAAWLVRGVIRPVNAVTETLEQLVSAGDVDSIPGIDRSDEIGLLARAGEALRDSHQRTAGLLSRSESLTRSLMRREAQLRASNADLDSFAYVASHDLRSPLRAIDNLASWIEEDCADELPEASKAHFKLLRRRVKRMENLLEDLLAYSRVGRLESPVEEMNLGDVAREAIGLINVPEHCRVTIEGEMPSLISRKVPLRQVIQNLISNAVKYNDKEHGEVLFRVDRIDGDFIEFSVSDNGPGIAPEYHDSIFGLFSTLQSRDDVESSGMGLAIVRKVINSRGASIRLTSSEGDGSRFSVRWPRKPLILDAEDEDPAQGGV
ncbi:MAG: ATP-binding protein [Halieaceae bacterium]|jgi:signal transduction histidine kinase|nr:ATP-binding protein [Halieaceae bacterium]